MTDKNERGYWMTAKSRTKFAETGPEMQVKAILEAMQLKMGFTFKHGNAGFPLSVICANEDKTQQFELHPDFIVSMPSDIGWGSAHKAIEVDGIHHETRIQERKRRWRDSLLTAHGYDVIHIDARLTVEAQRPYLRHKLTHALYHGSPVEMLSG